jgi:ArpU family phage transcriptional regulator
MTLLLYHKENAKVTFFPEVNIEKSKSNAKRKLREYPRWQRVANDADGQKVTATYTFEPRQAHGNPSKPIERLAINRVDAESELEAIELAVTKLLNPTHRRILFEKYLYNGKRYDFEIYTDLYLSEASFYIELNDALLSFAEQYRGGCLLVQN